jgi:glycosyltransferase involved in cell wall biosynthesis
MPRASRKTSLPHKPRLSVVVISRNEGQRLRDTVENIADTLPPRADILVVDDASTDGSTGFLNALRSANLRLRRTRGLGVALARNWGAARTSGDIVIFADAHLSLRPYWWQTLVEILADPQAGAASPAIGDLRETRRIGYGLTLPRPDLRATWLALKQTAPHHAPVLPGACLAMRRDTLDETGAFDGGLRARGGVDNELCHRLWLLGRELWIDPATVVRHHFRTRTPYPIESTDFVYNRLRLALVHLSPLRISSVIRTLSRETEIGLALSALLDSGISSRRDLILRDRVHTDDWFFDRFRLKW